MNKQLKVIAIALLLLFAIPLYAVNMFPEPNFEIWERHDTDSKLVIDHSAFQDFLKRYVYVGPNNINMVRYSAVTTEDKQRLKDYLTYLSNLHVQQYNQNVQLAYWINLYNALTIQLILAYYPVKSIRDINLNPNWIMRFIHPGPWEAQVVVVDGIKLSLNDIEHNIVRPIWRNSLVHYGFNCAAYSCPNLQMQPYQGATVFKQLEEGARQYINNSRGVKIENNVLTVSSIYDWYKVDFGGTDESVIHHLMMYANPELKNKLKVFMIINKYEYDWLLNGN